LISQVYDLHCHSNTSDGTLSPDELVTRAAERGVTTLALTDHDSISGLEQARICAQKLGIQFINGIEISAQWEKQCLHIVGLNIDPQHESIENITLNLDKMRNERAEKISQKLAKKGIHGALEFVQKVVGDGMITRTHFANFLVAHCHADTQQQAFDRFLGDGKVAFVSTTWTPFDVAIKSIVDAGGIAVLAHPLRYKLTASRMKKLLAAFKAAGGQAMEVVTGRYNPDEIRILGNYANQFELAGSVGSDFHSPANQWIELGRLAPLPAGVKPVWELLA
jgi:hypothetical protein